MMKNIILLAVIPLSFYNLQAQSWQHLTTGVTGYSNGYVTKFATAFTVYNNKLIVGGGFGSAGGNIASDIAAWDGTNWSTLNNGLQGGNSSFGGVKALAIYNTDLIAAGSFSAANTTTLANIAKWNGTSWSSLTNSMSNYASINALTIYNSKLIAAGSFTDISGTTFHNIAQWDGSNWTSLGTGISTQTAGATVQSMVVFNGELYTAGNFTIAGGVPVNNIAKWDGTTWSNVGTGFPNCSGGFSSEVQSLCVYNNELYAGNCTSGVSKWSGTAWVTVGGGITPNGQGYGVRSMTVFDNKLIVGGVFFYAGLDKYFNIAAWDGSIWTYVGGNPLYAMSLGLNGLKSEVDALAVFNGCLYAGGEFVEAMDSPQVLNLNHVAKYCGTVGIEEYHKSNLAEVYPNPSSGLFTFKGITTATKVEVYDITGRIVISDIINTSDYKLDLSTHDKGIYIYRIVDEQNRVQQGKLLVTE